MAKEELKVKRFEKDAIEWLTIALSLNTPYEEVCNIFVREFPAYVEGIDIDSDEAVTIIKNRIRKMRTDTRRVSYYKIKDNAAKIQKILDVIPIASPINQLMELEKLRQDPGLTKPQRINVIALAERIKSTLNPEPTSKSEPELPAHLLKRE